MPTEAVRRSWAEAGGLTRPWLLRAVTEGDVSAVAAFQVACWRESYRGIVADSYLGAMSLQARTAAWRDRVVSGRRQVAAAWDGPTVAGVVSWTPEAGPDRADELNTLYVAAARHGTGLAADLLHHAIADRAARLWVFDDNHRARRFYAKHRFTPTGAAQDDPDTGICELEFARLAAAVRH